MELIRKVCRTNDVEILAGHVGMDHIYLSVSVPLHILASKLVQYMGIRRENCRRNKKELNKEFWGRHLWARGYFVASSKNVTNEIIREYIRNQDLKERKKSDNFEVG